MYLAKDALQIKQKGLHNYPGNTLFERGAGCRGQIWKLIKSKTSFTTPNNIYLEKYAVK